MEGSKEFSFAEALDDATEQAVEEYDGLELEGDQSEDVEEEFVEDIAEEVIGEPESQVSEDIQAEEPEAAPDEGIEAAEEEVVEVKKSFAETGNPDDLPPELHAQLKLMQSGFTKRMQKAAEDDRAREAAHRERMQQLDVQLKKANVKPRPANPTESMSFEEQQQRWDDISKWNGQEAVREMVESGQLPDPDRVTRQLDEQERAAAGQKRYNMIASQEGFNEQVDAAMLQLSQTDQYWNNAIQSDEGAMACFEYVKTQLQAADFKSKAAELENARVKRSADAARRQTPKPATQTKAAATKPAENFADLAFEDKLDAVIRTV